MYESEAGPQAIFTSAELTLALIARASEVY
jgi:hypothetical protein